MVCQELNIERYGLDQHFRVFRGIPFAKPPIEALRWSHPEPPTSWAPRILNATQYVLIGPAVEFMYLGLARNAHNLANIYHMIMFAVKIAST